jgi:hypothetical protein
MNMRASNWLQKGGGGDIKERKDNRKKNISKINKEKKENKKGNKK